MLRQLLIIGIVVMAVGSLFYYLSVSPVRLECEIVFEYKGRSITTRAAGATKEDAVRAAVTAACGQMAPFGTSCNAVTTSVAPA